VKESLRTRSEGADDRYAVEGLAGLEIFGQQMAAGAGLGGGDDHCVPEGKPIAVLNLPASLQQRGVDGDGTPGQQIAS